MSYTVSDFYHNFRAGTKLIGGGGGLSRVISTAGILDYELIPSLKDKYFHANFHENQFALTTFLYAKDNPFLIGDAVKHLVAKSASGLAIKNVFQLQIPDSVLRYADAKNFPIFLIDSPDIYFEDVIYAINHHAEQLSSLDFASKQLDILMADGITAEEMIHVASKLNPSFETQHFTIFAKFHDFFPQSRFMEYQKRFVETGLNQPSNTMTMYKNGLLFICSFDLQSYTDIAARVTQFSKDILDPKDDVSIGVSNIHYYLGELKQSITESLHASLFAEKKHAKSYTDLGVLQILLPFCHSREMSQFSHQIMEKLNEYDAENNARLTETLETYCQSGHSIAQCAVLMKQHENTIRYRLEKIQSLTALDFRKPADLEQLSLACKIRQCEKLLV
ncbi:hypothetical protein M2140_001820 [Clostridiales Family XIII bacterium PM5-7]